MLQRECTYEALLKPQVVDRFLCCRCGTCAAVCPKIGSPKPDYHAFVPDIGKEGVEKCRRCYDSCPMAHQPVASGGGPVIDAFSAIASNPSTRERGQDGGACTAFLESLEGYESCTIRSHDGTPVPTIGDDPQKSSGSKYASTSSLSLFPRRMEKIAFVGLPCQVLGIHKAQSLGLLKEISLKIALFCTNTYDHNLFWETAGENGVSRDDVMKVEIRKDMFFICRGGEVKKMKKSLFSSAAIPGCASCTDFTGVHSDISFGSEGSAKKCSTVLVRTQKGKRLMDQAIEKNYIVPEGDVDTDAVISRFEKKWERNRHGQAHIH